MNPAFKKYLLKVTKSSACEELVVIQSLWSGYGKISRYKLHNSSHPTVVIKHIALNQANAHPRGWNTCKSHERKVKSYEVETYWYEKWSQLCSPDSRIPNFIGTFSQGKDQWIIIEDLNKRYPVRKHEINLLEVKACLKWLANFHATFLANEPKGLWKVGTYWNLETRPDEFELIENKELKSKAHLIDERLNNCKYQTIVHGDAKLANFCFSEDGQQIAGVDFQYVGGGCGMKDVAYFLSSCLTSSDCELYETELLNFYFSEFRKVFDSATFPFAFKDLEIEWRQMYPFAYTDFIRFLLGWMPSHQKINKYNLKLMDLVLSRL